MRIYNKNTLRSIDPKKFYNLFKNHLTIYISVSIIVILSITGGYYYFNAKARILRSIDNHDFQKALELIKDYINDNPNDPFVLKSQGKLYFIMAITKKYNDILEMNDSQTIAKSITFYNKLIQLKNNEYLTSDTYFFLGTGYLFIDPKNAIYFDKALKYLEMSNQLNKDDQYVDKFYNNHGFKLYINNQTLSMSIYGLLGFTAFKLEKYDKAIEYLDQAIKQKDTSMLFYFYLALSYYGKNIYAKAIELLKLVLYKEKDQLILEKAYFVLGDIFLKKKEYNQAIYYIEKIQTIKPSAKAYYILGNIYEEQKQITTALKYWNKALSINKKHNQSIIKLKQYENKYKHKKK